MYFYNDCSAELQSLYTPFGIWLPRNSAAQKEIGKMVDKSSQNPQERIKYLIENGKKFTTIIYINGHVMLYIGNYPNPNSNTHELIAMTYQTKWGLKPQDDSYRAIIGKSVLLPMLTNYPEDPKLKSLAGEKYFQITYLD
jgi:cell wall-associated NlpC family hydrolase